MSKNEEKAASYLPEYLIDNGYNVIPVNPKKDFRNPREKILWLCC
jgi:uncharacterized protein